MEPLDEFQKRVQSLERSRSTSQLFMKVALPLLAFGAIFWIIDFFMTKPNFLVFILAVILVAFGALAYILSLLSAHSESIEESERARRIRHLSTVARCIYLEGSVPDGKGAVGFCLLYQLTLVDYPYCIYCKEYTHPQGPPIFPSSISDFSSYSKN